MAKENYITIAVSDTDECGFSTTLSEPKGMKKGSAMNDVLEFFMLAKDEELYLQLKKKYLGVEKR